MLLFKEVHRLNKTTVVLYTCRLGIFSMLLQEKSISSGACALTLAITNRIWSRPGLYKSRDYQKKRVLVVRKGLVFFETTYLLIKCT